MILKTFAAAAAAVTLLGFSPVAWAQAPAVPFAIRTFEPAVVERLGREIYRQDRAAWMATDAAMAKYGRELKGQNVIGWVVAAPAGDGDRVRFLRGDVANPEVAFDVAVPARGAATLSEPAERTLAPDDKLAWRARATALAHMGPVCRPGYNTAVARDPGGEDWLVWLLAPQPAAKTIPVGGHYRFTISADGTTVKERDALFASCLVLDPGQGLPAGAKPTVAVASHVVSSAPVETHVFLQLEAGLPLVVITPLSNTMWSIDRGHIESLGAPPKPK